MKKYALILGMVVCLIANSKTGAQSCREFQIKIHNINQVEMCVSNFGMFGQTESGDPGCWWPIGSGQNYINGAGIWFGTIDSITGDTLVTIGYGPSGGQFEFIPGLRDMPISHPNAIIYMYPDPWPAPQDTFPMAPQDAISHQDSWCCYNDCDSLYHMPEDTRPIGIEIYQTVYAWDEPAIDDVIFMTYKVKNVSEYNLKDCYVGICANCDISVFYDQNTAILERPYFIDCNLYIVDDLAYEWVYNDSNPGCGTVGFDLLQTPFDLEWGADKDNDGIPDQHERDSSYYWNNVPLNKWDVDNDGVPDWRDASENPQLEMTAFKRFTLDLEPGRDNERYLTLAGYNYITGQYEPYDTIIPPPGEDSRFLISSGPFDIDVDSIITMTLAVVLADYGIDATPPAETCLVITNHWAQWQYDMNWFLLIKEETCFEILNTNFIINPNPTCRNTKISFSLSKSGHVSLKLYNTIGQLVKEIMQEHKSAGKYNIDLNMGGLAQGTYFLVLETPHYKTSRSLVILR